MTKNILTVLPDTFEDKHIIKSCLLSLGEHTENLYLKIPIKYKDELSDLADPWVILCLHKMMRMGGAFHVSGTVSKSLLANLEQYCECWLMLRPDYKPVTIIPDTEFNDVVKPISNSAIMTFSGGLDATFTLFRHKTGLAGRNTKNIEKAVLLFGAGDTPLDKSDDFKLHATNAELMCKDMGVEFLTIETNFCLYRNDWEIEHFNVIVAALNFFKNHPYKLTASTLCVLPISYKIWSSNPITDTMLSSNYAQVISDHVAYDRTMKANVVKNWELATKKMRVCWEGKDKSKNCGKCEKCIRTMLNFIATGIKEPLQMFPKEAYENMMKNANDIGHYPRWQYLALLNILNKNKKENKPYIKLVKRVLRRSPNRKLHKHSFWWHLRHLKF